MENFLHCDCQSTLGRESSSIGEVGQVNKEMLEEVFVVARPSIVAFHEALQWGPTIHGADIHGTFWDVDLGVAVSITFHHVQYEER